VASRGRGLGRGRTDKEKIATSTTSSLVPDNSTNSDNTMNGNGSSSNNNNNNNNGSSTNNHSNINNKRKRRKTTAEERAVLEKVFEVDRICWPTPSQRQELAGTLNMTPRQVQVWFQNKRQKQKQQTTGSPTSSAGEKEGSQKREL